jgi:hypothetical protein
LAYLESKLFPLIAFYNGTFLSVKISVVFNMYVCR